jgi:hypothetical protein
MLHFIMLIIFLTQFLVVLGALAIVVFFARPIVPLSGYSPQESPLPSRFPKSPLARPRAR